MDYLSTTEFESALVQGLKYTLNKMSAGRRADYRVRTANIINEIKMQRGPIDALLEEMSSTNKEDKDAMSKLEAQIQDLNIRIWDDLIVSKLYPELVKWGVAGIEGMTIDGVPVTEMLARYRKRKKAAKR